MARQSVWKELNHDSILNAVENTLQKKVSNLLLPRNSYINRVYELEEHDDQKRFIVKFYRPGRWSKDMILEEHQFLNELQEREIPVIPPMEINGKTLFNIFSSKSSSNSIHFALFPKKGGRALDEFDKETWLELGRLLARIHVVGAKHTTSKRITWTPDVATRRHLEVLYKTDFLLPEFKDSFHNITEQFIKMASPKFKGQEFLLIHGDCHKGNLIHRPNEGIFIVDFDDICFGPAVQDLWLLLPASPDKCEKEVNWLLSGYELFRDFPQKSLELIPLLRGMRIIHYISWLAIQSQEADFVTHFPQAGAKRYWNELIKELQSIVYGV